MGIQSEDKLIRIQDLLSTELDQETVLMSIDAGAYYGLGGVAQSISRLVEQYQVSPESCAVDVKRFLLKLQAEGLLRVE
jgi:hypothetical protein